MVDVEGDAVSSEEQSLLAHVASRYYIENRTRIEIAEETGLSRFKVARMLDEALETGVVSIEIGSPGPVDLDLSIALQQRFGLTRAIAVVTPTQSTEVVQEALGRVAADLLSEIIVEGDVLGITAGRTLSHTSRFVEDLPPCEVVQLAGVAGPVRENGIEVVRRFADVSGGRSHSIFAPLLVSDAGTAANLRRDPTIAETFRRFSRVTRALVAVGSWNPPDSQLYDNARSVGVLDELLALDVTAEVCSTLLDSRGEDVAAVADRSVAITTEQLRRIPEVIAVAGGPYKTDAVLAAIRSGIVHSLVTDAALAERLLARA